MRLSLRLKTLLDLCVPGTAFWDLCCDHGYLGEAAFHSGRFSEVIFNDAVEHLLTDLSKRIHALPGTRIVHSLAEEISEPLNGNVVIAGIGGEKTAKILLSHAAAGRLVNTKRILACPEKDAEWLAEQEIPNFKLVEKFTIPHNHGVRWIYRYEPC